MVQQRQLKKKKLGQSELSQTDLDKGEDAEAFQKEHLGETYQSSWWKDRDNAIEIDLSGVDTLTKGWLEQVIEDYFHVHDDAQDVIKRVVFLNAKPQHRQAIGQWYEDLWGTHPDNLT